MIGIYECKEEGTESNLLLLLGLEAERHWPPTAKAMGHPEWIDDARFATV